LFVSARHGRMLAEPLCGGQGGNGAFRPFRG
jgi:hypothetical protein